MKNIPIVLLLLAAHAQATDAEAPAFYGQPNCRIAALEPGPRNDRIDWSGACRDGYAQGPGVLTWSVHADKDRRIEGTLVRGEVSGAAKLAVADRYTYTGTLWRGVAHGTGFVQFADGRAYEGGFKMNDREGMGIELEPDGSRYEGEWKNDLKDGHGRMTFALGGSYEGEWRAGHMEGTGTMVYAGSGRTYQGLFRKDRPATAAPATGAVSTDKYTVKDDTPVTGSNLLQVRVTDFLPPGVPWERLTPAQKNLVRGMYPALEDGDEPPYPVKGAADFHKVATAVRDGSPEPIYGTLRLHVLVGEDGRAVKASVLRSPDPNLARYMAMAAMAQQYKSALCRGKPCEMLYAITYDFE